MHTLDAYGWNDILEAAWAEVAGPALRPARVAADFGTSLTVVTPERVPAELSGRLAHYASRELVPKVGDWVAIRPSDSGRAVIEALLPRRSEIVRKVAGERAVKQVIAANVDVAFVVLALDNDFSIERLKRYLYQLSLNAIAPVIVLNKADKPDSIAPYIAQLQELGLPIIPAIASQGQGIAEILGHIAPSKTAILLGSSGVGKSTLTNQLLGKDTQATQAIRASDDTGKHTTVHRELFTLPNGGLLIDTPGIRELQLWGTEEDLAENFDDVTMLARRCKYPRCSHTSEPGCAIRPALTDGTLDARHYANYLKMHQELAGLEQKTTARARLGNKRSKRSIQRQDRDRLRDSYE